MDGKATRKRICSSGMVGDEDTQRSSWPVGTAVRSWSYTVDENLLGSKLTRV